MSSSIAGETLHRLGKQGVITGSGDGKTLALHTLALTEDGTEALHCMSSSTAGMCSLRIAAEDEHLILLKLVNLVRRDAVGIVGTGIGATDIPFLLKAGISIKVTVHPLIVSTFRRAVAVPSVGCAHGIVTKFHDVVN